MKYFYIITFDGQIFELEYTEQKLTSSLDSWKNGGILFSKELGGGIASSSISKILNEEQYDNYTFLVKPKLFIRKGIWYDGKERKIVRYEKWKQEEIDNRLKLEEKGDVLSDEQKQKIQKMKEQIRERFNFGKKSYPHLYEK